MCLSCGKQLDGATVAKGNLKTKPKKDDVSVCFYCGHVMVFGSGMKLRDPTKEEAYAVAGDPVILAIQRLRVKESGKKPN